jgi:hypothetical protein
MSRAKPSRWVDIYPCSSGHVHVIWVRDGEHEHVILSLDKLANMLLDHGEILLVPRTVAIGILEANAAIPKPHSKYLN